MSNSDRQKFHWKGLDLHLSRGKVPVLTLVADATYPHLDRIKYPNGWTSTPANLTRAKDAAYGHARHLLWGQTRDVVRQAADPPSALYPPQYRPIAASLALGGCAGTSPSGCLREGRSKTAAPPSRTGTKPVAFYSTLIALGPVLAN